MKLVVGLGNPGKEYEKTRHNVGFMVVDHLVRELSTGPIVWDNSIKHKALITKIGDAVLVKPITFVNNSGLAVKSLVDFYKLAPTDIWVVHDDIDLPLGKIRIREKGGSAGHNGVTSIINNLKSDQFVRFRLGIGRGLHSTGRSEHKNIHHRAVIDFVLSKFGQGEAGTLKHLVKYGTEAVRIALTEGIDRAMNRFN